LLPGKAGVSTPATGPGPEVLRRSVRGVVLLVLSGTSEDPLAVREPDSTGTIVISLSRRHLAST